MGRMVRFVIETVACGGVPSTAKKFRVSTPLSPWDGGNTPAMYSVGEGPYEWAGSIDAMFPKGPNVWKVTEQKRPAGFVQPTCSSASLSRTQKYAPVNPSTTQAL